MYVYTACLIAGSAILQFTPFPTTSPKDRQARLLKRIEKEHHDLVKRMEKGM